MCVCVLPMSKSKMHIITRKRMRKLSQINLFRFPNVRVRFASFLQRHVAAGDAFKTAVFGAEQQRAVIVE